MGVRHALSPESSLTGAAMVRESDYAVWNELTDRAEEAGIGIQRGKTAGRRINRERDKPTDRHVYRQADRQIYFCKFVLEKLRQIFIHPSSSGV